MKFDETSLKRLFEETFEETINDLNYLWVTLLMASRGHLCCRYIFEETFDEAFDETFEESFDDTSLKRLLKRLLVTLV